MNAVTTTPANTLQQLAQQGQSVWLDYMSRDLFAGGKLDRLIEQDKLRGLTSNPAIFEKAIANGGDYAETLNTMIDVNGMSAGAVFNRLAVADIRRAADHFADTYRATRQRDGYVSLEVSPRLADDTEATVSEARRLWHEVNRPNLMIKVPATEAGLPAIETLIAQGINVNVTLLFSVNVYAQAAAAYLRGLERRIEARKSLTGIASVASFFVSRIDTAVDSLLHDVTNSLARAEHRPLADAMAGKVAIANAKLAYQRYLELFSGDRWARLAEAGAQPQRLLWASTSAKNPAFRDVRYVEELIGRDTVTTLPPATLEAFRDHGTVRASLTQELEQAGRIIAALSRCGIDLEAVTDRLLSEGVELFSRAYDQVLKTIERVRPGGEQQLRPARLDLPPELHQAAQNIIMDFADHGKTARLWERDKTLWSAKNEDRWLDWLTVADSQPDRLAELQRVQRMMEGHYFRDAVVLGMGGSSLAPELFARAFGPQPGHPELLILDSTDPEQIRSVEKRVDLARTAFIVASKSGSTLEPNLLLDYFFERVSATVGDKRAAKHFAVVTDAGSSLDRRAREKGFRRTFYGEPGVGGRYSALSDFGMVPAAVAGIDTGLLLRRARTMAQACRPSVPGQNNPGLQLGAVLGAAWQQARDKITLLCSPPIQALGAWIEQLLAESTGKDGKALIPVNGEKAGAPQHYGADRLFVYLRLSNEADSEQDRAADDLRAAGHPLVQINIDDRYALGAELFRWEFATAVAASVMGINAFDQPDVESAKQAARTLTEAFERDGHLPRHEPAVNDAAVQIFATDSYRAQLTGLRDTATAAAMLSAHLNQLGPGDYFALLAYANRLDIPLYTQLQRLRHAVRDRYRSATCLGYGPRYLHSTGQAHKGGPNTGVFLIVTLDSETDLVIPGHHRPGFSVIESAQAVGDFLALSDKARRVLRIHFKGERLNALITLESIIQQIESNRATY